MDDIDKAIAATPPSFDLRISSTGRVVRFPADPHLHEIAEVAAWCAQQVSGTLLQMAQPKADSVVLATPRGPVAVKRGN